MCGYTTIQYDEDATPSVVCYVTIYLFICLFIYLLIYILWVLPPDPHFLMLHSTFTLLLLGGLWREGMREVYRKSF